MGLNPGDLDRELTLQTATKTQDEDTGEEVIDWEAADEEVVWGQWLPATTREAYQARQRLGSYVDGVFRIYDRSPRPAPDTTRILFDGRAYDVRGVTEIGRGDGLQVDVVARAEAL